MIKIRSLRHSDLQQVLSLLAEYCLENPEAKTSDNQTLERWQHLYVPIHRLSQLLPPHWQFVPALYVAVSPQVLGLIQLSQDGAKSSRWKIDEIILDPDVSTYDVGTQLVNYVINRYGGGGVQTFLAQIPTDQDLALGLFKSCGFRHCAKAHHFLHANPADAVDPGRKLPPKGLRGVVPADSENLVDLYRDSLPAEVRLSLEKNRKDFYPAWPTRVFHRLQGYLRQQWVIEDAARDLLVAHASLSTRNYRDFDLSLTVSGGWEEQCEQLLRFAVQQALATTKAAQIAIQVFDFDKPLLDGVASLGFVRQRSSEILVKDYWIQLDQKREKLRSPLLIFDPNPASPAMNCDAS